MFTNSSERNETGAQDWTQAYEAVRWIQLVMALLSVLGSVSIIATVTLQRLSRSPELQPLLLLSVSDLLLALCWLIGAALFSQRCSGLAPLCYNLHTVAQILYMASFFFTLNYIWTLFTRTRDKYHSCISGHTQVSTRVSSAGRLSALLSGVLPVLLMSPVLLQGNLSRCHTNSTEPYRCLLLHTGALFLKAPQEVGVCALLHTYRLTVSLGTFLLTLGSISVLMVKSRLIYRRVVTSGGYLGNQQRAWFRAMERRALLYPLVFLLCWGPAAGLAVLRVLEPLAGQGEAKVVLYVSQAFTAASQGFLNSLVFGWTRAPVRRVGRRLLSRDVDTQTPLLREQKRRHYQSLGTVG